MGESDGEILSRAPEETLELGRRLGRSMRGGELVLLTGPIGAGKTLLTRGVAEALGAATWQGSPSFTLVNEYRTDPALYHIDLYRLSEAEAGELGLEQYIGSDSVVVVEWADRAPHLWGAMADTPIRVHVDLLGPDRRRIAVTRADGHGI